jgi:hypothetical protein
MKDDALIREQIAYYRQRAPEYDETSAPAGDPLAALSRRSRTPFITSRRAEVSWRPQVERVQERVIS